MTTDSGRSARSREHILVAVAALLQEQGASAITFQNVAEAAGVGRATMYRHWTDPAALMRDALGHIVEIREQKDLKTDEERAVREINPGIYASSLAFLQEALEGLTPNNAQKEYYLTDVVAMAVAERLTPEVMARIEGYHRPYFAELEAMPELVQRVLETKHPNLFEASWWNGVKQQLESGRPVRVTPYPEAVRFEVNRKR